MSATTDSVSHEFRKATMADWDVILGIYAHARELMAANGNPTQWAGGFPKPEVIRRDIEHGWMNVMVDHAGEQGAERILAVFSVCPGIDPTYVTIDGAWLDDDEYVTLHRVASSGLVKGAAHEVFDWVMARYSNVRVDTHPNNKAMQHVVTSNGFTRCGLIKLIDRPTDIIRIAYQRHDR